MPERELFVRQPQNPLLTAQSWPYAANAVFNAGAVLYRGQTVLLVRVEDLQGVSHLTVARSADGVNDWQVDRSPTLAPDPERPFEVWGAEDPRITPLDDGRYAVTYTGYSPMGPLVCLATTRNFRDFHRIGPVTLPENKDAALLPRRIDDAHWMLHRPVPGMATGAHIWISASPDLVHWGRHQVVLRARSGPYWDAGKIGLSAQPLETDEGLLVLYHGVKNSCFGAIYRQGLALLHPERPWQVLCRTRSWIFAPREPWERSGDVGNVVFSCGWTERDGEVKLYYGGADTCIALATAPLDRLLAACKEQR